MRKASSAGMALFGLALLCAVPGTARGQALQDKFWIQVSGYYPKIDTDITLSSTSVPTVGTTIDLEDDLGLDDRQLLPAVFGGVRIGGNFSIGAEYYALNRDTTHTIARDIVIEDVTYPANASVTSGFDTDVYRLTLGYAFVRRPNFEIGGAIGLHATNFAVEFSGQGTVGNQAASFQSRRHEFLAPLPTVGLFGTVQVARGLTLGARIDYLSLSMGDYDGRLINTQATLAYRIFRNVGIGVMYRYVDYRVDVEKERFTGRLAYSFSGPAFFIEAGF